MLARLTIEDPTKYESIRSRVLQHYAGAFIDTAHPANSQYKTFDPLYIPSTTTTFFDALLHPDLALRAYGGNGIRSEQVLLVICNALSFRIKTERSSIPMNTRKDTKELQSAMSNSKSWRREHASIAVLPWERPMMAELSLSYSNSARKNLSMAVESGARR